MKSGGSALRISVAAMLVALSVVASMMPSLPGPITKFSGFPLLLGGLLLGPRTAFAVGCVTDLIGFVLRPTGPFFPGFTLTQGLTALIPALLVGGRDPITWFETQKGERGELFQTPLWRYLRILGVFAVAQLVTSVLLVSYFRSQLAGTPIELELAQRSLAQVAHVPVYAFMALAVLNGLAQSDIYPRLLKARR